MSKTDQTKEVLKTVWLIPLFLMQKYLGVYKGAERNQDQICHFFYLLLANILLYKLNLSIVVPSYTDDSEIKISVNFNMNFMQVISCLNALYVY